MTRIASNILTRPLQTPILMAQVTIIEKAAEKLAAPVVKTVVTPAIRWTGKAFAKELLRRGTSNFLLKAGGAAALRPLMLTEIAPKLAPIIGRDLASPSAMLFLIGGIHIGELTIEQIALKYGLSLAAIAASAVAEEQARRNVKINTIAQASDIVVGTDFQGKAKREERMKLYRQLLPKFEAEQTKREQRARKGKQAPAPQSVTKKPLKPKDRPYIQVPKIARLPVVKTYKPVPPVSRLPVLDRIIPKLFRRGNNKVVTKPATNPASSSKVKHKTDEEQNNAPLIASRTVMFIQAGDKNNRPKLVGNSTYIKLDPKHPEKTENLVINRLIHTAPIYGGLISYTGHDAIHLITGFGVDPKAANSIPAPFPMTGIDAENSGLNVPVGERIALNGILQENITSALNFALNQSRALSGITKELPSHLRPYGVKILEDMNNRTDLYLGINISDNDRDFKRQSQELLNMHIGHAVNNTGDLSKNHSRAYIPDSLNTSFHIENFTRLLEQNKPLRDELRGNMVKYLSFVAQAEYNQAHGLSMPTQHLEFLVSPETTRMLIQTAIVGLKMILKNNLKPTNKANPVLELIHFYEKLLKGDKDSTPTVVFKQTGISKTA